MAFERKTAKMLSTSGLSETGETIFRVSLWASMNDMEIDADDDGIGPTIRVKVSKGRQTIYGRIDRDAYRAFLLKDDPQASPVIPMPADGDAVPKSSILANLIGGKPAPEQVPAPTKPVSQPLFSRAKALA